MNSPGGQPGKLGKLWCRIQCYKELVNNYKELVNNYKELVNNYKELVIQAPPQHHQH